MFSHLLYLLGPIYPTGFNMHTGAIPSELGNLAQLQFLNLGTRLVVFPAVAKLSDQIIESHT
jgi:hypothetical protein